MFHIDKARDVDGSRSAYQGHCERQGPLPNPYKRSIIKFGLAITLRAQQHDDRMNQRVDEIYKDVQSHKPHLTFPSHIHTVASPTPK